VTRYAIGLGSNLGDRVDHLRRAITGLGHAGELVAVSPLYETAPVGGPEQGPYLNAIAILESDLDPQSLLGVCEEIERDAGRVRQQRWGPRTLDVDIVASDGPIVVSPSLQVPHPRASHRRFVLEPLAAVWPGAEVAPGVTAAEALAGLESQEVVMVASDWLEQGS
jgi:2-amino-4-hydroxy-6-hydroxymethyldihydropteridine diphosphokinase